MLVDVRNANNALCREWQAILEEYAKFEHPSKPQLDNVVKKAKECLAAFDEIAMLEPEKYVQNTLIYNNCIAVVDSVEDLNCYELKEGEWKRMSFPVSKSDLKIPGQKDSWEEKRKNHQELIEQEYWGMNEADVALRAELKEEAAKLQAQLDELKAEKKSKGLFNFAEKGEVKERMKPYKEELAKVNKQLDSIDDRVEDYVEERLRELGKSFTQLAF